MKALQSTGSFWRQVKGQKQKTKKNPRTYEVVEASASIATETLNKAQLIPILTQFLN